MRVTFTKTDGRRYGVYVQRDKAPDLRLYGPGYHERLPHDLLHFVAEAEFGLDDAVFGDVAAGGNAKIFLPVDKSLVAKMWRKKRMHKVVLPEGRRSEELTTMLARAVETREYPDDLAPIVAKLDELARRWEALAPGESITLDWPRSEGRKRHPRRDRRRPPRQQVRNRALRP
jgi:hypothetical protein